MKTSPHFGSFRAEFVALSCALLLCLTFSRSMCQSAAELPKRRAVLIGIDHYPSLSSGFQLRYAGKDARDFETFLRSQSGGRVSSADIKLLADGLITGDSIQAAMDWLTQRCNKGDQAVIFWSGHGGALNSNPDANYFITSDFNPNKPYSGGAYQMDFLKSSIMRLIDDSVDVFLIVDACHAGSLSSLCDLILQHYGTGCKGHGKCMMFFGCMPDEASREQIFKGSGGNGVLTRALLDGLRGAAGAQNLQPGTPIEFHQIHNYIDTKFDGLSQHPIVDRLCSLTDWEPVSLADSMRPGSTDALASLEPQGRAERDIIIQEDSATQTDIHNLNDLLGSISSSADTAAWSLWQKIEGNDIARSDTAVPALRQALAFRLMHSAQAEMDLYLSDGDKTSNASAYMEAAEKFHHAMDLFGSDHPLAKSLRTRELFLQALAMLLSVDRTKLDSCRELLEQVLDQEPNAGYAYEALGEVHYYRREFNDATKCFREAERLAPKWNLPRQDLAQIPMNLDEWELARRRLNKLLADNDTSVWTLTLFGQYFATAPSERRSLDSAEYYFEKALRYRPKQSAYAGWIEGYLATYVDAPAGRKQAAIAKYQQAAREYPNYSGYYVDWANLYKDTLLTNPPDYDSSIAILRFARSRFPRETSICDALAFSFLDKCGLSNTGEERERLADSVRYYYSLSLSLDSSSFEPHVGLWFLAYQNGDTVRALRELASVERVGNRSEVALKYAAIGYSRAAVWDDLKMSLLQGVSLEFPWSSEQLSRLAIPVDDSIRFARLAHAQFTGVPIIPERLGISVGGPQRIIGLDSTTKARKIRELLENDQVSELLGLYGDPLDSSRIRELATDIRNSYPDPVGGILRLADAAASSGSDSAALQLLCDASPYKNLQYANQYGENMRYEFFSRAAEISYRLGDLATASVFLDSLEDGHLWQEQRQCVQFLQRLVRLDSGKTDGAQATFSMSLPQEASAQGTTAPMQSSGNDLGEALILASAGNTASAEDKFARVVKADSSWKHYSLYSGVQGKTLLRYGFSSKTQRLFERLASHYNTENPSDSVGILSSLRITDRLVFTRFGPSGLRIFEAIDGVRSYEEISILTDATDDEIDDVINFSTTPSIINPFN